MVDAKRKNRVLVWSTYEEAAQAKSEAGTIDCKLTNRITSWPTIEQAAAHASAGDGGGEDDFVAHAVRSAGSGNYLYQTSFGGPADGRDYFRVQWVRPDTENDGVVLVVDPEGNYNTYEELDVRSPTTALIGTYSSPEYANRVDMAGGPIGVEVGKWNVVMRAVHIATMPPTLGNGPVVMAPDGSAMFAMQPQTNHQAFYTTDGGDVWAGTVVNPAGFFGSALARKNGPLYATDYDRVRKSIDDGAIWTDPAEEALEAPLFAVDCSDNGSVVAAAVPLRLYVSTDGAATWSGAILDMTGANGSISAVFVSADGQYIVAVDSANGNVHWSDDQGDAFHEVVLPNTGATGCSSADCQKIFLRVVGSGDVVRSDDGGVSWDIVVPDAGYTSVHLACSADGLTIYSIGLGPGNVMGIFKSVDGGDAWSALTFPEVTTNPNRTLACSADGSIVIIHGAKLWRSTDGGDTFEQVGDYSKVGLRVNATDIDLSGSVSGSGTFPFDIAMSGLPVYLYDDTFSDGYAGAIGPDMMFRANVFDGETIDPAMDALFVSGDPTGGGTPRSPAVAIAELGTPAWCNVGPASDFALNALGSAGPWTVVGEFTDADWAEPIVIGTAYELPEEDDMAIATVHLSSAQLKSLHTSPIEVVAAPGAGKCIVPIRGFISYSFGTIAYTDPEFDQDVCFANNISTDHTIFGLQLGDEITSFTYVQDCLPNNVSRLPSSPINQPLILCGVVQDMTDGDGTAILSIIYQVSDA